MTHGNIGQLREMARNAEPIGALQVARSRYALERTFGLDYAGMEAALAAVGIVEFVAEGANAADPPRIDDDTLFRVRGLVNICQRMIAAVLDQLDEEAKEKP